jgi:hypothetical protein
MGLTTDLKPGHSLLWQSTEINRNILEHIVTLELA